MTNGSGSILNIHVSDGNTWTRKHLIILDVPRRTQQPIMPSTITRRSSSRLAALLHLALLLGRDVVDARPVYPRELLQSPGPASDFEVGMPPRGLCGKLDVIVYAALIHSAPNLRPKDRAWIEIARELYSPPAARNPEWGFTRASPLKA